MFNVNRLVKILACSALLASAVGCAATTKHESTGQYVDDSVITTKVKSAIFNETDLKTMQINVKTYLGVVQLNGFVDSQRSVNRAGDIARQVKDVVSVENSLLVK